MSSLSINCLASILQGHVKTKNTKIFFPIMESGEYYNYVHNYILML